MCGPFDPARVFESNFIFFCYFLNERMTFCLPNIFEEKKLTPCRLLFAKSSD